MLICVLAGYTGLIVGFVVDWLILYGQNVMTYIAQGQRSIKINILPDIWSKTYFVEKWEAPLRGATYEYPNICFVEKKYQSSGKHSCIMLTHLHPTFI